MKNIHGKKYSRYLEHSTESRGTSSGIPNLPVEMLITMNDEELTLHAKSSNTKLEKLKSLISKEVTRRALVDEGMRNAPPPQYQKDPGFWRMIHAYELVNEEFIFLDRAYTTDEVMILKLELESKSKEKVMWRSRSPKEVLVEKVVKDKKLIQKYRRIYVLEALAHAREKNASTEIITAELVTEAREYLTAKVARGVNDPNDKQALLGALSVLTDYKKNAELYHHWFSIYKTFKKGGASLRITMPRMDRKTIGSVFTLIRDRSLSGQSPLNKWHEFAIEEYIDILAANYLRLYESYYPGSSGYLSDKDATGAAEAFSTRGIGGQDRYGRVRPRLDVNGNYGDRD